MPIDGDDLGTDIKDAVEALTAEEKADLELAWQAISNEIADNVNPWLVFLPILEDWTDVSAFLNSWINYDTGVHEPAGFYKDPSSRVFLRGSVKDGVADDIFTLPAGYRPTKEERFAVSENGVFGEIKILPSGIVSKTVGGNTRLHFFGVSFRI